MNACVQRNLLKVDPGNRDWNPSDPRWAKMKMVIAQDCYAELDQIKHRGAPELEQAYLDALRLSYGSHLSSAEADTLIRFYESDPGQKYQAFQAQLATVAADGMGQLDSGKVNPNAMASAPDVIEPRMNVLRLLTTFSMLIVASEDERRAVGHATGAPAIGIMLRAVAASQGNALDRIGREHSANLGDFSAFSQSQAETDELRAIHEAIAVTTVAAGKFAEEFSPELNGDLKKWRDLYKSLPRDKPSAPIR